MNPTSVFLVYFFYSQPYMRDYAKYAFKKISTKLNELSRVTTRRTHTHTVRANRTKLYRTTGKNFSERKRSQVAGTTTASLGGDLTDPVVSQVDCVVALVASSTVSMSRRLLDGCISCTCVRSCMIVCMLYICI